LFGFIAEKGRLRHAGILAYIPVGMQWLINFYYAQAHTPTFT